ncbi:MAG: hypothetical protein GY814_16935 [Gammaproteobacteria bacterium]|nr:hypothetical protein [Gammaproteobacteria bacterium]
MKINLTSDFVANNLICPEGKRKVEFCDKHTDGVPGMYTRSLIRRFGSVTGEPA